MKTFAVVYVPDMNAKTQTVREIKEIQSIDELAKLKKKYPGRVEGQPFVSVLYTSTMPALSPGDVVPMGYDPLDTDL